MENLRERWPKWLFYATLCFGFMLLTISYIKQSNHSKVILEANRMNKIIDKHDWLVVGLADFTGSSIKTSFISIPQIAQECKDGILGLKQCSIVTNMVQQELVQPTQISDPMVERQLDDLKARLNELATSVSASQDKGANFKYFYDIAQDIMKPVVSIIVLLASLFAILSKQYKADTQKRAFGSLGTILGFWLK